jgi:hypothetical protein
VSLPESRYLAQRLLTYEAGKNPETKDSAACRVCSKLRRSLIILAGVAGFRSLLSRAVTLARAEAPSLSAIQVAADGSLQGLDELESQMNKDLASEGGVVLIARLLDLLLTFIGKGLTLRIVQDVWPEADFDVPVFEKERNA